MSTNPNHRFFAMMSLVILVAGLIWLGIALVEVQRGGSFNWGGVVIFLGALAAFAIARSSGKKLT
jgi:hypothetical protein